MYYTNMILDRFSRPYLKLRYAEVEPAKRDYIEHHHTECEIAFFLSGSGSYRVGHKKYDITAGDIFIFASNEIHYITEIGGFAYICLHFEPRILWLDNKRLDSTFMKIFFDRNGNFENRLDRNNPNTAVISEYITKLYDEMKSKKPAYAAAAQILLDQIFLTLIRGYDFVNTEDSFAADTVALTHLESAMKYIDANLDTRLTLDGIAQNATMSRSYFCTVFKKFNGISPWEYITIKRIEKSIRLLKTSGMNKIEIAYACGFNSPSNFYKAFRHVTGKTPSDIT